MNPSEAQALVALLVAAFPRADWPDSTQRLYRETLVSFGAWDGRIAVERLIATRDWPPSVAEIRRTIAEETLALPSETEAWELAAAHADARRPGAPRLYCLPCAGTGRSIDTDDGLCPDCEGQGRLDELDLSRMPPVPDPIPAVVRSLGGWRVLRETTRPELLRRDFLDAYRRERQTMIERASLAALGANGDHPVVEQAARREIEASP